MYTFLVVLIVILALFIIFVVLVQDPKGATGSTGFGGAASNIIGVQRAGDVLEKTTWGSAIALLLLCVFTSFFLPNANKTEKIKTLTEQATTTPSIPVATPNNTAPNTNTTPAPAQK